MNMSDDLEGLARLHKEGALSDDEFAKAKQKVLAESHRSAETPNRHVSLRMFMTAIILMLLLIFFFGLVLPRIREHNDHRIFELRVPRD